MKQGIFGTLSEGDEDIWHLGPVTVVGQVPHGLDALTANAVAIMSKI